MRNVATSVLSLALLFLPAAVPAAAMDNLAWEKFLASAEVTSIQPLGKGVTLSHRVTLSDGNSTAKAVWKTIDEYVPVKRFDDGGPPELGFRDSYKSEIAAYRLDRLIGLDQVPPTVAREIRGQEGSLQLWIDNCITEGERQRKQIAPPDPVRLNQQMRRAKVFFQLIQDVDYVNLSNLLIDPDFKLYKIDSSRAFRTQTELLDPDRPERYSQSLLEGLRKLDEKSLKEATGPWLSKRQRKALLARRDAIVARAERRIEQLGASEALYP